MNKVFCDICGTAYPESAAQCPICGSANRHDADRNMEDETGEAGTYQFVKGGRFSKRNVKARMKRSHTVPPVKTADVETEEEPKSKKGLLIASLLLLALVLVIVIYIALRFFPDIPKNPGIPGPQPSGNAGVTDGPGDQPSETLDPENTEPGSIPCKALSLRDARIDLTEPGATAKISINVSPSNTTDPITYRSGNEAVVSVNQNGQVTAVGEGSAVVTVSCGEFKVQCTVKVTFPPTDPADEPTQGPTDGPTDAPSQFTLNRTDISFFKAGESWDLYSGTVPLNQITWSSDNEGVATVKNGVVKAVGPGSTKVHAEYNGEKLTCLVRCNWEGETIPNPKPTDPPVEDPNANYYIYINGSSSVWGADVSLGLGQSFQLTLVDEAENIMPVTWTADEAGIVSIEGNTVTAVGRGTVYVSCRYAGSDYTCIVRVG